MASWDIETGCDGQYGTFSKLDPLKDSSDEEYTIFSRNDPADYANSSGQSIRSEAILDVFPYTLGSKEIDSDGELLIKTKSSKSGPLQDGIQTLVWTFTYSENGQTYKIEYPCKKSIRPGNGSRIKKYVIAQLHQQFHTENVLHENSVQGYKISISPTYIMDGVIYHSISDMINKSTPQVMDTKGVTIVPI